MPSLRPSRAVASSPGSASTLRSLRVICRVRVCARVMVLPMVPTCLDSATKRSSILPISAFVAPSKSFTLSAFFDSASVTWPSWMVRSMAGKRVGPSTTMR